MKKLVFGLLVVVPVTLFAQDSYQEDASPTPPAPRVGKPIDRRVPLRAVMVNAEVVQLDAVKKRLNAKVEMNPRIEDAPSRDSPSTGSGQAGQEGWRTDGAVDRELEVGAVDIVRS